MHYITINKLNKEPIYLQLANSIKRAIDGGILKHSDHLPTEEELCERFDISNIVVKQAYQTLVEDNLVERIRGKGTYVKSIGPMVMNVSGVFSLEGLWETYQIEQHIILQDVVNASAKEMHYLNLEESIPLFHVVWVGLRDHFPVVMQEAYVPLIYAKSVVDMNTNNPKDLWDEGMQHLNIKESHSSYEYRFESIEGANARILNLEDHTAVQVILAIVKDGETALGLFKTTFPGQLFRVDYSYGVNV